VAQTPVVNIQGPEAIRTLERFRTRPQVRTRLQAHVQAVHHRIHIRRRRSRTQRHPFRPAHVAESKFANLPFISPVATLPQPFDFRADCPTRRSKKAQPPGNLLMGNHLRHVCRKPLTNRRSLCVHDDTHYSDSRNQVWPLNWSLVTACR